jgi:hypothetical protein
MALAGEIADPGQYNTDVKKLVGRARRITNSSTTTTEVAVLQLDGIAVKAGRAYLIETNPVGVDTSVANDGGRLVIRYATGGATAAISSTTLDLAQQVIPNAAHSEHFPVGALYPAASDDTLSILLTVARSTGSGSVGLLADPTFPLDLLVWDCGVDPGDTGIVL